MSATNLPAYDLRSTTLTPYLTLPHLLSLTWLAYPILSLLFVAFRLQLSSASAQDAVASAKDTLIASCLAAEKAATSAASLPRYMAIATNERIADAVNSTMNGARAALVLALTVMEAIINFIVDTYRSTFLCFLELVVRGGLEILMSAVQELSKAVGAVADGIRSAFQGAVNDINSVIKVANKVPGVNIGQVSVPDLSALQNVTLPADFMNALTNLNNSLPTLADLKSTVDDLIDTPFELLKKDINDTFAGLSFDSSVLPIPQQNTVSFCDQMDTSVVDDLGRDLIKIAKIGVVLLVLLALILVAANCALEWYKWRCLKNHLRYTREAWVTDPAIYHPGGKTSGTPTLQLTDHNLMMLQGNMMHPLLTKIANRISALLRLSPSKHIHLSWFFHYVFHPPALACFLIGFFGLLSVQVQLLAISPLEHKYQGQAQVAVHDFSNLIATSLNASMYNQSAEYAGDINGRVDHVQSLVNDGLFGWVNGTTTTLNDTINAFYNDLQNAVATVFKGTILESPVEEFIRCFIGSKVDAIEHALTFLHDNLNIDIPRVNDSVLVISPAAVNEATQPIASAAIGGGDGDSQGIVGKLVNAYTESLKKERIMFAIFMGLWGFVVLMALAIIFWHSYGRDWVESYKKRRWQKTQRGIVGQYRDRANGQRVGSAEQGGDVEKVEQDALSSSTVRAVSVQSGGSTLAAHPYPHGSRPEWEKSWEDILDQATTPEGDRGDALKTSPPRKLLSLGKSGSDRVSADSSELPWYSRLTGKFTKKDEKDEGRPADGAPPMQERVRPKLTITTSNGSVQSFDETAEQENDVPSSAWSVSPRRPTWKSPRKLPSLHFKARSPSSEPEEAQRHATFALPIHHAFPKADSPLAPPPPPNFQLPAYVGAPAVPPPPGLARPLTGPAAPPPPPPPKTHKRQRSSMDPFLTPFDDERYGVVEDPAFFSARQSVAKANPFVATAL